MSNVVTATFSRNAPFDRAIGEQICEDGLYLLGF
jgi:hypothetical protein